MGQTWNQEDPPRMSRSMMVFDELEGAKPTVTAEAKPFFLVDAPNPGGDRRIDLDDPVVAPAQKATSDTPIQITPLTTPSISLKGIGTGSVPRDVIQGRMPPVRALPTGWDRDVVMGTSLKQWCPSAIRHKPTYFEDTMLERHGQERYPCVQSLASGVRFFGTLPVLPYLMTLHPPACDVYNLGHFRPGTSAPCLFERPPYDARALGVQTAATAGAILVIP